ncbi:MAG: bifunctional DNA-formamidopyrimidine glycosylase/DNA-(apurinic or apyrimidinic site) lyase [Pseudomonadota bacterium]
MPELPEIETIRTGLTSLMEGQKIQRAAIGKLALRHPFPDALSDVLTRARITQLRRRSKYILIDLDNEQTLIVHLGMSGRIFLTAPSQITTAQQENMLPEKHDHFALLLSNGVHFRFNDTRRFGAIVLYDTKDEHTTEFLSGLGPEPLGNAFHQTYLLKAISNRKSAIKTTLLDQKVIAGIGNIYASEALWRAGIAPTRKANTLSEPEAHTLVRAVVHTLQDAIDVGKSTLGGFDTQGGELGYFEKTFDVYEHADETCTKPECNGTIERIVQQSRSTYFCPKCQQ